MYNRRQQGLGSAYFPVIKLCCGMFVPVQIKWNKKGNFILSAGVDKVNEHLAKLCKDTI